MAVVRVNAVAIGKFKACWYPDEGCVELVLLLVPLRLTEFNVLHVAKLLPIPQIVKPVG